MYAGSHQPASGQQSAFSHPPHFMSGTATPPGGYSSMASNNASMGMMHPPGTMSGAPSSSNHSGNSFPSFYNTPGSAGTGTPPIGSTSSAAHLMNRHGNGGRTWSPLGNRNDEDAADDDEEEDDEDDDDDEDDEDEDDDEDGTPNKKRKRGGAKGGKAKGGKGGQGKKAKPSRGAKACSHCRKLKMRCTGAENGPPCDRCRHSNHDCIFEESNRGKKTGKHQRTEAMAASLRKMEATMNSLIACLKDPANHYNVAAGISTRSPSPDTASARTKSLASAVANVEKDRMRKGWPTKEEAEELRKFGASRKDEAMAAPQNSNSEAVAQGLFVGHSIRGTQFDPYSKNFDKGIISGQPAAGPSKPGARFAQPEVPVRKRRAASPRLHSLPDNTLNPLGLLAEASLHNHNRVRRIHRHQSSDGVNGSRWATSSSQASNGGEDASPASVTTSVATGSKGGPGESPNVAAIKAETPDGSTVSTKARDTSAQPGSNAGGEPGTDGPTPVEKEAPKIHDQNIGVASETYFKPGPMTLLPLRKIVIERELAPELLTAGIVTSEEVLELFEIFFNRCSMHIVLFDPDWHTPTMICGRSPFLFTVICTIAAKYYDKRTDLYMKCLESTRKCAYVIMSRGFKSVEIIQGFLLLSLWQAPSRRFEEDKTWLFSGVAIRMATDLNLHRKSMAALPGTTEPDDPSLLDREREILNRERTWLLCFCIDRSISGQMGKPWTIREDWITRNCRHWAFQRLSKPWDLGVASFVELLRIMGRQFDFLFSSTTSVSGLNNDIDYSSTLRIFNAQLFEWRDTWQARGFFNDAGNQGNEIEESLQPTSRVEKAIAAKIRAADTAPPPSEKDDYNTRMMYFIAKQAPIRFNYAVLLLNSFGLQHAVDFPTRSGHDKGVYFSRCLMAAKEIVTSARGGLRHVLAYSPDTHYILISYACVFLLKLSRPAFSGYADEDEILALVAEGADLLDDVALNSMHTPALYATFVRALLQSRQDRSATNRSGATTPYRSRAGSPADSETAEDGADAQPDGRRSRRASVQHGAGRPASRNGGIPTFAPDFDGNPSIPAHLYAGLPGANGSSFTAEHAGLMQGLHQSGFGGPSSNAQGQQGAVHIDQLLNESFWSTLLPPGFGGPLDTLAAGSVEMYPSGSDGLMPLHGGSSVTGHNLHNDPSGIGQMNAGMTPHHASGGPMSAPTPGNRTGASTPQMVNMFAPNISFDFPSASGQ